MGMTTENIFIKQTTSSKMPANRDSYLSTPELYISDLPISVGDEELKKTLKDVDPIEVIIHRQPGNINNITLNGVIRFSSIENAEKAFAIYNNIMLEAYKTYLSLKITDPTNHSSSEPQSNAYILQVDQLPVTTTNLTLFDLFRPFGPLFSTRIQYPDKKNKGNWYALVQFFRQEDAERAIMTMNCQQIEGKNITVTKFLGGKQNKSTARANITSLTMPNITGSFSPPANKFNMQTPSSPGPEGPNVDPCNLFIKNLDANISSSDLFNHFRRYGRIISARVMRDQETGNSKGFGFVSYTSSDEADRAKASMHGKTLGNKQIVVRLHEPKKLREAKLANHYSSSPASPSESRVPSRRNSELLIINTVNEFGREDLAGLAPKARREVLMSELQKRFKSIPSIPQEEVNPIIDYLLNMKTDDVLHILKDASSLQQKISEARYCLYQDKKRRGSEEVIATQVPSINNNNTSFQQIPQHEKFTKAINKIYPQKADEILELIMTLSAKERSSCYFNPEYLNKKISEAYQALAIINEDVVVPKPIAHTDVKTTTISSPGSSHPQHPAATMVAVVSSETPNGVHSAAYEEIEQFIEGLKNKPLHEQKQKLGNRLFPLVKNLGLKSGTASKVTINLLDTDDLRELAHSMNEPEKFRQRVLAAEKIVSAK
ncbi:12058_t:CDS:2 [Acaulospora morrowiae]|uniref:12058_t:CDS:1 n=1 Tax=Acaulospora morrowiae TaxID=94023 RepID=A0A9N9CT28_9GLOM|nr:12058_t:CDS:2 [Acaulospora morrowiae]